MKIVLIKIKRFLDKYIYLLPVILLAVDFICVFFEYDYVILGNILGYSLVTNIALFYLFFYRKKYCWFTRLSPIGLCLINIVNIMGIYINDTDYHILYISVIFIIVFFLSLILQLKKIKYDIS